MKPEVLTDETIRQCLNHTTGGIPIYFEPYEMYHMSPNNGWDIMENEKYDQHYVSHAAFFHRVKNFVLRQLKLMEKRLSNKYYCTSTKRNPQPRFIYNGDLIGKHFLHTHNIHSIITPILLPNTIRVPQCAVTLDETSLETNCGWAEFWHPWLGFL